MYLIKVVWGQIIPLVFFLPFNTTEQLLSVAVNLKFVSLFEQTKIKSHVYSVVNWSACVHALINF